MKSRTPDTHTDACKLLQSCPTLRDPMHCSPPGSSVHGILQARILEWVAFPSPGGLPDPGIQPASLMSPVLTGGLFNTSPYLCIRHLSRRNAPGHGHKQSQ